jgi:PAS domain S-box-containing protein
MRPGIRKTNVVPKELMLDDLDTTPYEKNAATKISIADNAMLNAIFNSGLLAIAIADEKNIFIEVNKIFCNTFGLTKSNILGKPVGFLFPEIILSVAPGGLLKQNLKSSCHKNINISLQQVAHEGKTLFLLMAEDITDRKNAEQKIIETELNYRSLIEQATDAICILNASMKFIDVNTIGLQWLEYSKNEFLELSLTDVFFAEDLISDPLQFDVLLSGKPVNKERRFKKKDGTAIDLEINVKLLQDGRMVVFARDITKRNQVDKALQAAYTEKNTILESIADAFFAVDKSWIVTYWNKEAERILCMPRNEILGKHLWEKFSDAHETASYKNYHQALNSGQHVEFEDYYKTLHKWFEVSAYPSEAGLSVYFKDITERKIAGQMLIENEARYRTLFEQNVAGVYQTTSNGVILNCNEAFAKMLKYDSPGELLCKNASQLYFSADHREEFVAKAITQKQLISYECKLKCKDGTASYFIENISSRKDELTGEIFFDGIMIDITETKRAELLVKESNERYDVISKATNDMVWDWDLVTGQVHRNKEGWRKLFRTPEDGDVNETGEAWDERVHPDDWDKIREVTDAIKKTERDFFEVECRVRRDDGTWAYIHDRGQIIRNERGEPVRLLGATQDITARKEAEIKVAKSEYRFRSLVQNGSDLTTILDEKGYYVYCSPAIKRILGYYPESMEGKNAFAFIHPEDAVIIKAYLSKKQAGGYVELIPFRFKNAQGEWRWLESRVTNQCDNPEINGYVFNSRDITEKKMSEAEINKLSIIARETMNAVVMTDPEGKITWVNEAFTRITEFEFDEAIGRKPGELLQGAETNPAMVKMMHNKLQKLKPFECDVINYSRSGRKYWVRIQCQPQFDEAGKLKYFFGLQTDITREKEAETVLKASEERYRYLFNNNPASIFIWDINTFEILEVNDNAVKLYGHGRQDFLTKTVFDLTRPVDHEIIKKYAVHAIQKKDFKSDVSCRHINKKGEEMYMHVDSHRIKFKGRQVILALATNITDKVLLEKMLEEEKLAKQKEITEAVISAQEKERHDLGSELHDNINQILAGSLLYLGLAKRELGNENAHFRETEVLISSAIDEIRKLSHSLIPPALSESEFLEALRNIVQLTGKTSGIAIRLQSFGFDESIVPDKMKLNIYRIIQEQFNNILKHAAAKKILIRLTQECNKTILTIKDDGVGFDTTKKSTGVGLMNMKTRASLFNGELNINSSPGRGCELKVVFTLPTVTEA